MTGRDQSEYSALRATIRERGTARVCIFAGGIAAWAAADDRHGRAGVDAGRRRCCRCCVLAAIFEAVFALHVGVERIGRYIQVFHEGSGGSGASGSVSRSARVGARGDGVRPARRRRDAAIALFSVPFLLAALFNIAAGAAAQSAARRADLRRRRARAVRAPPPRRAPSPPANSARSISSAFRAAETRLHLATKLTKTARRRTKKTICTTFFRAIFVSSCLRGQARSTLQQRLDLFQILRVERRRRGLEEQLEIRARGVRSVRRARASCRAL